MVQIKDLVEQAETQKTTFEKQTTEKEVLSLIMDSQMDIQNAIKYAIDKLIAFQDKHKPEVSVSNHPSPVTSVSTPDIKEVVEALSNLQQITEGNKVDFSELVRGLNQLYECVEALPSKMVFPDIPTPPDEVSVKNFPDLKSEFKTLNKSIQKIDVRPEVKVAPTKVNLDLDSLKESLQAVVTAVENIEFPVMPEVDYGLVVVAVNEVKEAISSLSFPVPNYVLPFKDSDGKAVQAPVGASGKLLIGNGLIPVEFNRITFTDADGNGNYQTGTVKKDGTTVGTLTLAYDGNSNLTDIQFN